jgi:hypothetical protein
LRQDRSEAIDLIKFPDEGTPAQWTTAMKSFLGCTRIFQPHVPDYAFYSARLMCKERIVSDATSEFGVKLFPKLSSNCKGDSVPSRLPVSQTKVSMSESLASDIQVRKLSFRENVQAINI